jgi:hypothetical protein
MLKVHLFSRKKWHFNGGMISIIPYMQILKYFRLFVSMALFGGIVFMAFDISSRSHLQQQRKYDDANINHMKYGMFNVNSWKEKLSAIIVAEIEEFKINKTNKIELKGHVENQLSTLIDKVEVQIRESNKGSTTGWLKQKFIETLVDVDDIKEGIPNYADTIVQEMTKSNVQRKLKDVIKSRLSKYLEETFEEHEMAEINDIIVRSGKANQEEAMAYLSRIVPIENSKLFAKSWILIILSALLFFVSGFHRKRLPAPHFLLCLGTLVVLLYAGVTCPMIDMVAKISRFSFMLLGHPVEFTNQVVYFQSKSILDVFWILISDPNFQMKVVGVMMIAFSIVFPLIKIVSSILYYYNIWGAQDRWIIKFFVLKSGKWSMTDVQIVAIMMAYIGFNGMVTTQFNTLRETIPQFELISTNDTTLQIGFYIFLCYVVLALFLAGMIERTKVNTKK